MIPHERLVAPAESPGLLIEPSAPAPAGAQPGQVAILGRPLSDWRRELRAALQLDGPVILSGHQPEFFHAGVLAKTIAAAALAERYGGAAVFLLADSDAPRSARLTIPQVTPGGLRRVEVALPGLDLRLPYEHQPAQPASVWLEFLGRVAGLYAGYEHSLLRPFADAWLRATRPKPDAGGPAPPAAPLDYVEAFGQAHAAALQALGVRGVRSLRLAALASSPAFRAFAVHLIRHAGASAAAYNAAIDAYRRQRRVRSPGRPVPRLAINGGRYEAPFWASRAGGPRRRLLVEGRPEGARLWAEAELIGTLPYADSAGSEAELAEHPLLAAAAEWRLRPRALTLSGFARLFLSDLFIHGIGGAKYDAITDAYLSALLGCTPAPLACISATLHLPLPVRGVSAAELAAARQAARDVRFNPQRHLAGLPQALVREREDWIRRAAWLRETDPRDRVQRRTAFEAVRRLNAALLEHDPWRPAQLHEKVETLLTARSEDALARDREYFFALHPAAALRDLRERIYDRLGQSGSSRPVA